MSVLDSTAEALGIRLTPEQLRQFAVYQSELLGWNTRVNLTAITDPFEVQVKHFADSLSCLLALPSALHPVRLVDVGTGAGFPGLPLKIACPEIDLALLDSIRKKTVFLEHLTRVLGLTGVEVLTGRAEELGRDPSRRESYDVVTSRAVAELCTLVELCLPLTRVGGRLIAQKKDGIDDELRAADRAISILGGRLLPLRRYQLPGLTEPRLLVVVEKVVLTPPQYPRRAGVPEKRPL